MDTQTTQPALPMRQHTILGICEGIGEDLGFNPLFLRVPFAASVLWSPQIAVAAYLALGVLVLASRLLFPKAKPAIADVAVARAAEPAGQQAEVELELPLAA